MVRYKRLWTVTLLTLFLSLTLLAQIVTDTPVAHRTSVTAADTVNDTFLNGIQFNPRASVVVAWVDVTLGSATSVTFRVWNKNMRTGTWFKGQNSLTISASGKTTANIDTLWKAPVGIALESVAGGALGSVNVDLSNKF